MLISLWRRLPLPLLLLAGRFLPSWCPFAFCPQPNGLVMPSGIVVAIAQGLLLLLLGGLLLLRRIRVPASAAASASAASTASVFRLLGCERISNDSARWSLLLPASTFVSKWVRHNCSRSAAFILFRSTLRPTAVILRRWRKALPLFGCDVTL
jgi:hypothetical protein